MTCILRTVPLTLTAVTLAFPALADFTAQEYWDYTVQTAQDLGTEIRAKSITDTDTGLIIEGVTLDSEVDGERFGFAMEGYTLNNHQGGGVELLLPDSQDILVAFTGEDGATVALQFTLTQQGFASLMTGELTEMNTTTSAGQIQVALASATVDGTAIDVTGALNMKQIEVISDGLTIDYSAPFSYDLKAGSIDFAMAMSMPEVGVSSTSMTHFDDLSAIMRVTPAEDPVESTAVLEFTASGSQNEAQQSSPEMGTLNYTSTTGQMAYNAVLQDKLAALAGAASDVQIDMDIQSLPIGPIALEASVVSAEFGFPVSPAPDAQTAALALDFQGLKVSENVWRMVDPVAAIPRDPITLTLEMDADLNISPTTTPSVPGTDQLPVDIVPSALRIQTLFAAIGGATLAGTGAFTFDPSDFPLTPGQAPTPEGTLDLSLTGALELLQQLTNGGVITSEQAMGAQMMMGMMLREGPNGSLETQIQSGADGSISINGNRIR